MYAENIVEGTKWKISQFWQKTQTYRFKNVSKSQTELTPKFMPRQTVKDERHEIWGVEKVLE